MSSFLFFGPTGHQLADDDSIWVAQVGIGDLVSFLYDPVDWVAHANPNGESHVLISPYVICLNTLPKSDLFEGKPVVVLEGVDGTNIVTIYASEGIVDNLASLAGRGASPAALLKAAEGTESASTDDRQWSLPMFPFDGGPSPDVISQVISDTLSQSFIDSHFKGKSFDAAQLEGQTRIYMHCKLWHYDEQAQPDKDQARIEKQTVIAVFLLLAATDSDQMKAIAETRPVTITPWQVDATGMTLRQAPLEPQILSYQTHAMQGMKPTLGLGDNSPDSQLMDACEHWIIIETPPGSGKYVIEQVFTKPYDGS